MNKYLMSIGFLYFLCTIFVLPIHAQVTIGSSYPSSKGSLLDLKENDNIGANANRGFLSARVALESIDQLDPCVSSADATDMKDHVGLLVYNLTDDQNKGLCPGLHVWIGSRWARLPEPCSTPVDPVLLNSPNCYIVKPGGVSEEIPIAKAYLVSDQRSDLQALDRNANVSVSLLWQDQQNLISDVQLVDGDKGIYSKIKVTANNITGNALVAVRVGADIAWSWHIWVTDYDPNTNANGTTYAHNNGEADYLFMDRNIGATSVSATDITSMGLTYQWGRKDPFPANVFFGANPNFSVIYNASNAALTEVDELNTGSTGTGIQHVEVSEVKNLSKSILNPMIYYYAKADASDTGNASSDWFTSDESGASSDSDLWGGTSGSKSVFDPCPEGWKVPAMSSATQSPWVKYEGIWEENATLGANGFRLDAIPGSSGLGFYPYGFPRFPRAVIDCVGVGCQGEYYTGGSFATTSVINTERGAYWTATSAANNVSASASGILGAGSPTPYFTNLAFAKSGGAYVRCVKAD